MNFVGNPELALDYKILAWAYRRLNLNSPHDLIFLLGIVMFFAYAFKNSYLAFLYYLQNRFTYNN